MANETNWEFDPTHSAIDFKVRHMMISQVRGRFESFEIKNEGEDLMQSEYVVEIEAKSIDTNDKKRDEHMRSEDFLDVENHEKITFKSSKLEPSGDEDNYRIHGTLTIKGVSKEASFDLEYGGTNTDPWGNQKAAFSVSGKINRKDYGLTWNETLETGGVLVGDTVNFTAEIQFVKKD